MSLVQANYRGVTLRRLLTGNIVGPNRFRASEEPTYGTAFRAIMICYAPGVGMALGLWTYLQYENGRRTRVEGFEGSAGAM